MATREAQIQEFLDARRHAIFATNRARGAPQLSPVWYLYDGRLYVSLNVETAKYRNLLHDPSVSVCIDAGYPDWRCVVLYGAAELVEAGDPRQAEIRRRILRRYYDTEAEVEAHIARRADPSKMAVVIVAPDRIVAQGFEL